MTLKKHVLNLMLGMLIASAGCFSENPQDKLDKSFAFAKNAFLKINTDLVSSLAFQDLVGQGATLTTWVSANYSETDRDYGPYALDKATAPWTVVLRQDKPGFVTIEGYGEDLTKPLMTETVELKPVE